MTHSIKKTPVGVKECNRLGIFKFEV